MAIINLNELEKALRLKEGTLKAAIESEDEIKIETSDLTIFTKEEYDAREANMEQQKEKLKKEYKTAGVEMAVKEIRNEMGYEFEGKTIPNLLKAHEEKVLADAKLDIDPKIKSLQADLEQMTSNFTQESEKVNALTGEISEIKNNGIINGSLSLGDIDANNLTTSKSDIDILYKHKHKIGVHEGVAVMFKDDGEIMKDEKTLAPITAQQHYQKFISENYMKTPDGGAGGGDEPGGSGGSAGSWDAFVSEQEKKGHAQGSEEFSKEMNSRISDGTLEL